MLIDSPRLTAADRRAWSRWATEDLMRWRRDERRLRRALDAAVTCVARFITDPGGGYCGVSWGKDSVVVLAVLAEAQRQCGATMPAVWVRVEGRENPECPQVRDAVLAHPWFAGIEYHEVEVTAGDGGGGLTSQRGFDEAARRFGARHISGVRSAESYARAMRERHWGTTSAHTCAPITALSTPDVYAIHAGLELPLHPAYAMSMGGRLDRWQLRVASLGGLRGTERGRREWEWAYYRDVLEPLGVGRNAG